MKYDPELAALLAQQMGNNACRGYVIYAMENCGFSPRTSGVWWQSSMRSLTSAGWRRPSSTLRTAPTDLGTTCPQSGARQEGGTAERCRPLAVSPGHGELLGCCFSFR